MHIRSTNVTVYKRRFDETRHIYFFIKEEKVFIKYMEILEKVRNIIKTKFNSKLIYSKKYLECPGWKNFEKLISVGDAY